jgi:biopolymer transport protein ExbB
MIKAFMQIQKLGGNVNANVLAGGIWEALVTSAAGLSVGIAALIIHNYLAGQVRTSARLIEQTGDFTIKILGSPDED